MAEKPIWQVTEKNGLLSQDGKISVPYLWDAGEVASKFLIGLRDEKKIYGNKCIECNLVYVPPKKTCIKCFRNSENWVELSDKGTLETYTIIRYHDPDLHWIKAPFAYGIIKLDGADTGMVHYIGEADLDNLRIGLRMKAVFREKGEGNYLDIMYFKPI